MNSLHEYYTSFTERGWIWGLLVSCVLAALVFPKFVPRWAGVAVFVLAAALTIGWMLLDLAYFPGSHNLLPFEAMFKLLLLVPIGLALAVKFRTRRSEPSN